MEKTKEKNKISPIKFRIEEISILDHNITDPLCLSNFKNFSKDISCSLETNIRINNRYGTIEIRTEARLSIEREGVKHNLMSIHTSHIFKIKSFNKVFKKNVDGKAMIPNHLMLSFAGISISGTRGMLVARNIYPEYKKIFIPAIDPLQLLPIQQECPDQSSALREP